MARSNDPRSVDETALRALAILAIGGAGAIIIYALRSWRLETMVSIAGIGILFAGASFPTGGLLGFLFGIPRTLQSKETETTNTKESGTQMGQGQQHPAYRADTNLERISDWRADMLRGLHSLAGIDFCDHAVLSTTAGAIVRDARRGRNLILPPELTALRFATPDFQRIGYVPVAVFCGRRGSTR
jgi:hypothetical protein